MWPKTFVKPLADAGRGPEFSFSVLLISTGNLEMSGSMRRALRGLGMAAAGVSMAGAAQAAHLRWRYRCPGEPPGERHGHAGRHYDGKPLKLLFVGDSIAVGVGAKIAAPLQAACAERLAKIQRRPVEWCTIAANGADVRELHALVDEDHSFDIAVVLCGVNDGKKFLQGRWPSHFREDLAALCGTLRKAAPESVVTVPQLLGHVQAPLFQQWPMCHLVDALFGQFEAQKTLLEATGAVRALSADSAMPVLQADARWWSVDGVHPSGEGYRKLGEWLAPLLDKVHSPQLVE